MTDVVDSRGSSQPCDASEMSVRPETQASFLKPVPPHAQKLMRPSPASVNPKHNLVQRPQGTFVCRPGADVSQDSEEAKSHRYEALDVMQRLASAAQRSNTGARNRPISMRTVDAPSIPSQFNTHARAIGEFCTSEEFILRQVPCS